MNRSLFNTRAHRCGRAIERSQHIHIHITISIRCVADSRANQSNMPHTKTCGSPYLGKSEQGQRMRAGHVQAHLLSVNDCVGSVTNPAPCALASSRVNFFAAPKPGLVRRSTIGSSRLILMCWYVIKRSLQIVLVFYPTLARKARFDVAFF